MSGGAISNYKNPNVAKPMSYLLEKYAIIHADYAPSSMLIIWLSYIYPDDARERGNSDQ